MTPDGSGGSSGHRSPGRGEVDDRAAETRGGVSQERRAPARDTRERGNGRSGNQREGSEAFEDESGTDSVTRRSRKRKSRSRSRSRSGLLNGDGRPSDQSSRGVHDRQEKNGGVDEARVEGEGEDADEGTREGNRDNPLLVVCLLLLVKGRCLLRPGHTTLFAQTLFLSMFLRLDVNNKVLERFLFLRMVPYGIVAD